MHAIARHHFAASHVTPTRSAFEAEDVHWLNSREAANKAFEKAIAREDRCCFASFQSL